MNQVAESPSEYGKCCELNTTRSWILRISGRRSALEKRTREGFLAEWHLSCDLNDEQVPVKQRADRTFQAGGTTASALG